jgi:hypothetical protein
MQGQNFIHVLDDVIPTNLCADLIRAYDFLLLNGNSFTRRSAENAPKVYKDDAYVDCAELLLSQLHAKDYNALMCAIEPQINEYITQFEAGMFHAIPGETFPISHSGIKLQRTRPSQGYHVWHCENTDQANRGRVVSWILYLNDVSCGGETEFLHLSERVAPKSGRLLLFPAGWTHTHRGNPPLTNDKYIVTGWIELTR